MNILVTGFEQFGKYKLNPTEVLCDQINGIKIDGHSIFSYVLSTSILGIQGELLISDSIFECVKKYKIDILISFGIASSEDKGLRIELKGYNEINNIEYALPHEHCKELVPGGDVELLIDMKYRNTSKIIQDCIDYGLLINDSLSIDPGRYCCNGLIYSVLSEMKRGNKYIPFMYAHCSCTAESIYEGFDPSKKLILQEDLIKYLMIIVRNFTPQP